MSEITKRDMFSKPLSKEARNSGIMAGFEDEDFDDMQDQTVEDMPPLARTPQNPEILMNNLRGDMRSVDARIQELAQLVGDQAAQETPPEVLALLQTQLAAQQGGIGALPGAMPPPAMPAPGGMPGMPPGMDQGIGAMAPQGAMPPGMESAPPFPQGAEQAPQGYRDGGAVEPPTPDGLPPLHAFYGAAVNMGTRLAQMGADKAAMLAQRGNAAAGALMSQGFPQTFRPVFENVRGPGGRFLAEQTLKYPTLTEHLANAMPTVAQRLPGAIPGAPAAWGAAAALGTNAYLNSPNADAQQRQALEQEYESAYRQQTPDTSIPVPALSGMSNEQLTSAIMSMNKPVAAPGEAKGPLPAPAVPSAKKQEEMPSLSETAAAIAATSDKGKETAAAKDQRLIDSLNATGGSDKGTYIERVKAKQADLKPLYRDLLGDSAGEAKTNALLLLADAAFKYGSTAGPTPLAALSGALQNVPKGLMSIVAQAKDRQIKVDSAALSQALSTVDAEDKFARQQMLKILDSDTRTQLEMIRQRAKSGVKYELAPAGRLKVVDRESGSNLGYIANPNSQFLTSALTSRNTLTPASPFVRDAGPAAAGVVENEEELKNSEKRLASYDRILNTFDNLQDSVQQGYGPDSAIVMGYNKVFVPFGAPLNRATEDSKAKLQMHINRLEKEIASSHGENGGKLAVQEQQWARDVLGLQPGEFFSSPELAAKRMNTFRTQIANERQHLLTQLGAVDRDYVMDTPPSGTAADPFVLSKDPEQRLALQRYLQQNIGSVRNPNAKIYLKMPNGTVQGLHPNTLMQQGAQ